MSSSESDEEIPDIEIELGISAAEARTNYSEAGSLVLEEDDPISQDKYKHLLSMESEKILSEVVAELKLPYELTDFQNISLNTIYQKKDLILLSPTGSGKESSIQIWI